MDIGISQIVSVNPALLWNPSFGEMHFPDEEQPLWLTPSDEKPNIQRAIVFSQL